MTREQASQPGPAQLSLLLRHARHDPYLSYRQVAVRMATLIGDAPGWEWVRWIENAPPRPLSDPVRADALFRVVGITWEQALRALGCGPAGKEPR